VQVTDLLECCSGYIPSSCSIYRVVVATYTFIQYLQRSVESFFHVTLHSLFSSASQGSSQMYYSFYTFLSPIYIFHLLISYINNWSRGTIVGTMTGQPRNRCSISHSSKKCFSPCRLTHNTLNCSDRLLLTDHPLGRPHLPCIWSVQTGSVAHASSFEASRPAVTHTSSYSMDTGRSSF